MDIHIPYHPAGGLVRPRLGHAHPTSPSAVTAPTRPAQTVGSGTLLVRTDDGAFTFVHQSVMEWLVANAAARQLRDRTAADTLSSRRISRLMVDFLCDLAGHDLARRWATETLAAEHVSQTAKQNALDISARLGGIKRRKGGERTQLQGTDLRRQDLAGRDLGGADLRGADLRNMRLVETGFAGADLTGADFSGARLIRADLTGAVISGSQWARAALLGVVGTSGLIDGRELRHAAVAGRDLAEVVIAQGGSVNCVALSPDGALHAVGRGTVVDIADLASGETLRLLTGHVGQVLGVAFSPDGTLLATASSDTTARIWDTATGQARTTLTGHTGRVNGVAFSPDGTLLATASDDQNARIWDITTGRPAPCSPPSPATPAGCMGVAFSPDGTLLATASTDRTHADLGHRHRPGPLHPHRPHRPGARGGVLPRRHPARHRLR